MGENSKANLPDVSEEPNTIRGLVADILNEREVVLNIGIRDGVQKGMHFGILHEGEYEVKDPVTGEVLGALSPRVKIRVQATEVLEKMTVARTYEVRKRNVGGTGTALAGVTGIRGVLEAMTPPQVIEEPYTFRVGGGGETYYRKLAAEESIVQIGDHVISLTQSDK